MNNNVLLGALPVVSAQVSSGGGIVSDIYNPTSSSVSFPADNTMVTLPSDNVTYFKGGPTGGGGGGTLVLTDQTAPDYIPQGRTQADIMKEFEAAKGKPFDYVPPAPEDETPKPEGNGPKPMSKKNMMLIGVAALVLGYLVLRRK